MGSRHKTVFDKREAEILLQAGAQIAAAIKIDHGFRRMVQLSGKLKEEKRYLEEELRTEYNFEEIVGESRGFENRVEAGGNGCSNWRNRADPG